MLNILTVFVGGGIGAVLRYVFSLAITKMFYVSFLGTLCVNIVGCFFIGFISGFFLQKYGVVNSTLKIFLTVGILGGFTTFSSFGLETFELLKNAKYLLAVLYILVSVLGALTFTYLGFIFSKSV